MRVVGPSPGWPKEPEGPKPIGGKEGDFAVALKSRTIPAILNKLPDCVTIQTQRLNPMDFEVTYKVDQRAIQDILKQLDELKNLTPEQSMHVQEAIGHLKNVENMEDSHDALALDGIKKARQELELCLR